MNKKVANRSVMHSILMDYKTNKPIEYIDYANVVTTEMGGETVYAYGGDQHAKRVAFRGEPSSSLKIETQIKPFKLYEIMLGGTASSSAVLVKREVLTSTGPASFKITLSETPASSAYLNVFKVSDDCGTALTVTVADKVVTLPASETAVGQYVAYYMYTKTGAKVSALKVSNTSIPKLLRYQGKTINIAEDGTVEDMYITYFKLTPKGDMSINFSNTGDPMTMTLEFEMLVNEAGDCWEMVAEELA